MAARKRAGGLRWNRKEDIRRAPFENRLTETIGDDTVITDN